MDHALTAGWVSGSSLFGAVVVALALALMAILALRLLRYRGAPAETLSLQDFSISRYEPMARLLSEQDVHFLASRPGYRREIGDKLRRNRRRILRLYLRELAADFQMLHAEARKLAAVSPEQHSQLVGSLVAQQFTFWRALAVIEARLILPNAAPTNLDLRGLIASVEAVHLDLAQLSAAA